MALDSELVELQRNGFRDAHNGLREARRLQPSREAFDSDEQERFSTQCGVPYFSHGSIWERREIQQRRGDISEDEVFRSRTFCFDVSNHSENIRRGTMFITKIKILY